jgi:hypothetical protein
VVYDERDDGAVINFGSSITLFFQGSQKAGQPAGGRIAFLENKEAFIKWL